ncbi:hypothetical protein [Draconibacterium halophilum]|uniref:Peptidase M1 n=1 Tax=Draconibacterium halophilum TaxID=2706887 RepID=A0A6C0R7I1_9BACT|nr:hypothetical protein [Draconibacterium halophilum]QIA06208.1 hypothetical protein G0Q07_00485 [Draconibacterium halophilum]
MRHRLFIAALLVVLVLNAAAQKTNFTHQDTLRGSITPERVWWDLTYYHLNVKVDPADSTIIGSNLIQYLDAILF